MADLDVMFPAPREELRIIGLPGKIRAGAIGEVGLGRAVHRVIAGIDPGHCRDRAELADRRVGDLGVVHDVGIVAQRHLLQDGAGADLAIDAELHVLELGRGINSWFGRK